MDGPYPREEANRLARDFVCGECGGALIDPWGGAYGTNGQVVRCLAAPDHQGLRPKGCEIRRLYDGVNGKMVNFDVQSQQTVRAPGEPSLALQNTGPAGCEGAANKLREPMPVLGPRYRRYQQATVVKRAKDYLIDGVRYQRVTTMLGVINKPALVPWARGSAMTSFEGALRDKVGSEITPGLIEELRAIAEVRANQREAAPASQGQLTHEFVDRLLKEGPAVREEVPPELLPAVDGAAAFLEDYGIEVIATEHTVWSELDMVAGTFDLLGRDKQGRVVIADWKRSRGIYWEYALQLGAYAHYLHWTTGYRAEAGYVVRLPQEPVPNDKPLYEAKAVEDLDKAYEAYQSAARLYRAKSSIKFAG